MKITVAADAAGYSDEHAAGAAEACAKRGEECVDIGQHDTGCHDAAGEVM